VKDVAPVAHLITELDAKITDLEKLLATSKDYDESKKSKLPTDAGVAAVLAQAIADHADKSEYKGAAADVRDAAIKLWKSDSYDAAKAALAAVKEAAGGKSGGAAPDYDWAKLARLSSVMSEVNKRNGQLRRATRKAPPDPSVEARSASVLAILSLVAHEDTHEVKGGEADIAKWKAFSLDMQKASSDLSVAFEAKNADDAKKSFEALQKSCSACHADFRKE
jgi:cytochrome c556